MCSSRSTKNFFVIKSNFKNNGFPLKKIHIIFLFAFNSSNIKTIVLYIAIVL